MHDPVIVPRAEHPISRRDIDPDALKVLYRLQQSNYAAYLVGGSVRDLLLERRPKDFDVGTDAHPYQVKKLFRNCWIIGRRFRLAHVRFGNKAIEVATFRKHVLPGTENEPATAEPAGEEETGFTAAKPAASAADLLIRHDNTFGTPEEDAFRRDFTINALFYDIATFSIIDYVGGLHDLREGVIRSIGDPRQRFQEDPVRMLRAVAFAARLDFSIDPLVQSAIAEHRHLLANAAPARLIEEYYKVLRSGAAEKTFSLLADHGLLETITPELHHGVAEDALWEALAALDRYRQRFDTVPPGLTNAVLLGALLVPLSLVPTRVYPEVEVMEERRDGRRFRRVPKEPPLRIGMLPVARRDVERLRQILALQRRLRDTAPSPRSYRLMAHRGTFDEALAWLEIHGGDTEAAAENTAQWRSLLATEAADGAAGSDDAPAVEGSDPSVPRRRRRRRRRRRPGEAAN